MPKRQRKLLSFDDSKPSIIIGMSSVVVYYKLAHYINKKLDISLKKMSDFFSIDNAEYRPANNSLLFDEKMIQGNEITKIPHPLYYYEDIDNHLVYFLIQNTVNGDSIVVTHKNCDYMLIINNISFEKVKDLQKKLLSVKFIEGVFIIEENSLSNNYSLFDELDYYILENSNDK